MTTIEVPADAAMPARPGYRIIPEHRLRAFVERAARAVDMTPEHIPYFVDGLVESDLRGIDTHGIMRVPPYLRGFAAGELNARPNITVARERGVTAVIDGDNGLGGIVGQVAMKMAIERAAAHGIGLVSVRNSNHSGMLAQFVQQAIARDMIGYFVSNGPAAMAPWGGIDHKISNNPFAWGIPAGSEYPILLDMACSAVARGKIRLAATKGERIPLGWALDPEGNPTEDPDAAMTGLILPAGGYKGSGLAVINEVLAAVLPGATLSMDASRSFLVQGATMFDSWKIGHTAIAIDIACFDEIARFKARVDAFVRRLKSGRRAADCEAVLMPGEPEELYRRDRLARGVPIAEAVLKTTDTVAEEFNIAPLR